MGAHLVRILLVVLALVAVSAAAAQASFPGANGKIAFDRQLPTSDGSTVTHHVFTANPDGTDATDLTIGDGFEVDPSWSADGRKHVSACDRLGAAELRLVRPVAGEPHRPG